MCIQKMEQAMSFLKEASIVNKIDLRVDYRNLELWCELAHSQ